MRIAGGGLAGELSSSGSDAESDPPPAPDRVITRIPAEMGLEGGIGSAIIIVPSDLMTWKPDINDPLVCDSPK